jgi:hypothetical protein
LAYRIQDIRRAGILQRIESNYWPPELKEIPEDPPISVALETVSAYFVLLTVGILVSALILMVEIQYQKQKYTLKIIHY